MNEREKFEQILKEKGKSKPTKKESLLIKSKKTIQKTQLNIIKNAKEDFLFESRKQQFYCPDSNSNDCWNDYWVIFMLESFYEDIKNNLSFYGDNYEYTWSDYMLGLNENEPVSRLTNYIFTQYMLYDTYFKTMENGVGEDYKHLSETQWNKNEEKKLNEVGYRMASMKMFFKTMRNIFKHIMGNVFNCTSEELEKKLGECISKKQWFINDGYVNMFGSVKDKTIEKDSIIEWICTMYDSNPTICFTTYSPNHIIKNKDRIKAYIHKQLREYVVKMSRKCSGEDMVNVYNEFMIMIENGGGYDRVWNIIFDTTIKVMNTGDIYVCRMLIELRDMGKMTRNNRRIEKQGFVGDINMYNSRLGIEKTPQELHKLLF